MKYLITIALLLALCSPAFAQSYDSYSAQIEQQSMANEMQQQQEIMRDEQFRQEQQLQQMQYEQQQQIQQYNNESPAARMGGCC